MSLKNKITEVIKNGDTVKILGLVDGYDYLTNNLDFMSEVEKVLKIVFEDRNNDGTFNLDDLNILKNELESGNILLITKLTKSILLLIRKVKAFDHKKIPEITETFLRIVSFTILQELTKRSKEGLKNTEMRNKLAKIIELLHDKVEELQLIHEIAQNIYLLLKENGLWCCGDDLAKILKLDKEFSKVQDELRETINEKRITNELNKKIDELSKRVESGKPSH
ncbi:MAG: hypothetical protein CMF62_01075 [Magnetococcales bacterium]|nr:hypothetical protein [Magnetococcales bacterium]|tara:strand:+ start:48623 stop:49291 length:669 start_codon:yes stop_codon:yes gene_type:complete